jgi:signal transduction histidine kinase
MLKCCQNWIILLCCLFVALAKADPVDIAKNDNGQLIGLYSDFLVDNTGSLTFEDVSKFPADRWQKSETNTTSLGFSKDALWMRLELSNSGRNSDWVLEIANPLLDEVDVYIDYGTSAKSYLLGDLKPFSERIFNHRNFVIPINLQRGETATVTIHVETQGSLQAPLQLWSQKNFMDTQQGSLISQGVFYGFLIVMILYNLFLYFYIKELRYLKYVFLVFFSLMLNASLSGFGFQFLWPVFTSLNAMSIPLSLGFAIFSSTVLARDFLRMDTIAPRLSMFFKVCGVISVLLAAIGCFVSYHFALIGLIILVFPVYLSALGSGLLQSLKGDRVAQFFTLAWASPMIGALLLGLNRLGVIEPSILNEYGYQIGLALEVVLLSFALAEYIAQHQRAKIEANEEASAYALQATKERDKKELVQAENKEVTKARDLAEKRSQDVSNLLNNSGQGFISFGASTIVEDEYSQACLKIFKRPPSGIPVAELFYAKQDEGGRIFFNHCIKEVLAEEDEFRQEMMLSLLPGHFEINDYFLKAEYKLLSTSLMMIVLTDITNEVNLEQKIKAEYARLSMLLAAVTEQVEVSEINSQFKDFLTRYDQNNNFYEPSELYRNIHTFKGLFNQFCFCRLPLALHEVEQELGQNQKNKIDSTFLWQALEADLNEISTALEGYFDVTNQFTQVSKNTLIVIKLLAKKVKSNQLAIFGGEDVYQLLNSLEKIFSVDLKLMLKPLTRGSYSLADQMGKKILIDVSGDEFLVRKNNYKAFINSLIHVFRNAIDHAIEPPDVREELGKDETGLISCRFVVNGDDLHIQIQDDGGGIRVEKLREKLINTHQLTASELNEMSDHQVLQSIFEDGITTRDNVTDISGRGVGLAATKMEVDKLGGNIMVSSLSGEGSTVEITLPLSLDLDTRVSI